MNNDKNNTSSKTHLLRCLRHRRGDKGLVRVKLCDLVLRMMKRFLSIYKLGLLTARCQTNCDHLIKLLAFFYANLK